MFWRYSLLSKADVSVSGVGSGVGPGVGVGAGAGGSPKFDPLFEVPDKSLALKAGLQATKTRERNRISLNLILLLHLKIISINLQFATHKRSKPMQAKRPNLRKYCRAIDAD